VLCNSDNDVAKEAIYIREMHAYRPSGLIIVPADLSKSADDTKVYLKAGAGVVYVDRIPTKWKGDSVSSDHEYGAYVATKHLIGLGHQRIATITGPLSAPSAKARLEGFRRAMLGERLKVPAEYIEEAEFNKAAGQEKAAKLLRLKPRPTAIVAANDLIAFGVLTALREAHLCCPEDLSLVGFDNLDDSDVTVPTLSTVDQFAYQLGARAVDIVVARVRGDGNQTRRILLTPELRIKQSTAPVTVAAAKKKAR
jgi:DNA-binding LacI/PurR family transcriptional regulator